MQFSRRNAVVSLTALVGAGYAMAQKAFGHSNGTAGDVAEWDWVAAAEVKRLLHNMHEAWNNRDLDFVRNAITDSGFIGTFELTADETPIVLQSRDELVAYVAKLMGDMQQTGRRSLAAPQVEHEVMATATFAVCTEQCDLVEHHEDGSRTILPHRATSVVRKGADGWKFVHWHVSRGGPSRAFDPNGNRIS